MKRPWHCSICTCVSVYRDTRKGWGIVLCMHVCLSIEAHERPRHCFIHMCLSIYGDIRKGRGIVLYIRVCPSIEAHRKAEALFYACMCVRLWGHMERRWHCPMRMCVSVYRDTWKGRGVVLYICVCPWVFAGIRLRFDFWGSAFW